MLNKNSFEECNNYRERCRYQTEEWVKGNAVHNYIDNECCPDFSCCKPELLQPKEIRETFLHAKEEQRLGMLFSFLGAGLSSMGHEVGESVHLADGKHEITKDQN